LLAPSTNRLLTAYLPPEAFAKLNAGKLTVGLELYGLVEVLRQAEYVDCTPAAFQELSKNVGTSLGKVAADKMGDVQEEMAVRLKALGAKPIEIGKPEMLGGIFEKTDAFGYAMLSAYKQEERSVTMIVGMAFLRVKQRLIFVYLYRRYESSDSATLIRRELETWADAILAKNKLVEAAPKD
jgi:hypothetical protein